MKKLSIKERTAVFILRFMSNGLSMSKSMDCAIISINEIRSIIDEHNQGFLDWDVMSSLDKMVAEIDELRQDLNKRK